MKSKRLLCLFLCILMISAILPETVLQVHAETYSGTCGDNLTWSLNTGTKKLTITGSGDMYGWDPYDAPWWQYNESIETVSLPSGLTGIGMYAFAGLYDMTTINIPANVTYIDDYAFMNAHSLTSVTIPAKTEYIGAAAFGYCISLQKITVNSSNTEYASDSSGVLYSKDKTVLYCVPGGYSGTYTVPNSVTSIWGYAFWGCTKLTKIAVNSSHSKYSADSKGVLFNKDKSRLLVCPGGYSGSYTIPSSVTDIRPGAFDYCTSLNSVTIPSSVTAIPESCFQDCWNLASISIPSSVTSIGESAFYFCYSLTSVTIPSSVTELGEGAFSWSGLESVTIKDGLTEIGSFAFYACYNLSSITFPATLTKIGEQAFDSTALTSIVFPVGLVEIEPYAFYNCDELSVVTVPDTVSTIGMYAFGDPGAEVLMCGVDYSTAYSYAHQWGHRWVSVAAPSISKQPKSVTVSVGESATFSVTASGPSITYQWQYKKSGSTAWTNYSGATSSSLTVKGSNTNNGCQYRCVVKNLVGQVISNAATLTVKTVAKPTITTQPKSATVTIGESATFKVVATGESLSYKWQYKKVGESSWTDYYGGTTASITVKGSATNGGCQYRCIVSNPGGSVTSSAATLTVNQVAKPTITTQPKSATVNLGESATFKVVASGSSLSYKWQYKKVGESSWTDYYGGTSASITVKGSATNNGCQYRCIVSNPGGSVTSSAATLTVITVAKPTITTQPMSGSVAVGESMTFTCAATGEGTLSYQWQYRKSGDSTWTNWSGATKTYFSVKGSNSNNGCQYRCVVTNAGGSVNSGAATLTVTNAHNCPGAAFTDMPAYGTTEHAAIDWAVRSGVTTGTSATTFGPNKTVTRGQVVTFLWRASGSPEPRTTKNPFTDVAASSYCYKAVLWANENNITNGTSATTFSPNKTCTRAHILTFLYRQQGSPAVGSVTVPYTDVKSGAFYEAAMKWAYANGIDKGVTATTFAPGADCTRVSTVVFLYRAITGQGRLS